MASQLVFPVYGEHLKIHASTKTTEVLHICKPSNQRKRFILQGSAFWELKPPELPPRMSLCVPFISNQTLGFSQQIVWQLTQIVIII